MKDFAISDLLFYMLRIQMVHSESVIKLACRDCDTILWRCCAVTHILALVPILVLDTHKCPQPGIWRVIGPSSVSI